MLKYFVVWVLFNTLAKTNNMKSYIDEKKEKLIYTLSYAIAKIHNSSDCEIDQMVAEWNVLNIEDLGYAKIIEQEIKLIYREVEWKQKN